MPYLLRFALRSLRVRLARTVTTVFAVVLGVAVILATSIAIRSTETSIVQLFDDASGRAGLIVTSASSNRPGFPEQVLNRIGNVPGVVAAVPSLQVQTQLADAEPNSNTFLYGGSQLLLWGIDPQQDQLARDYEIVAGRFLSGDETAYEIVLVEDYAAENKLTVGEDLQIIIPGGAENIRIVGLMTKEGPGRLNNGSFGVLPLATAQYLFSRPAELDQVDVVVAPGVATGAGLDELKRSLQSQVGTAYVVTFPAAKSRRVVQMIETYKLGLSFFSSVTLFVGMFLIYNVLAMTVAERTREIGMLRTVGMLRWQIARQTLTEALSIGVLGSILGILVGLLLARGMIWAAGLLFEEVAGVQQVSVPVGNVISSLAVGIVVTLLAASLPAWQASRVSPLEALRVRGRQGGGWLLQHGWRVGVAIIVTAFAVLFVLPLSPDMRYNLGRVGVFLLLAAAALLIPGTLGAWQRLARPVIRRVYGNEGVLGISNLQRARLRATLTAAALMICIAMMVGIRGLSDAFQHDIGAWVNSYIGGDLHVYSALPMRSDLQRRLESVEGVAAATPVRYVSIRLLRSDGEAQRLTLTAIDPQTHGRVAALAFTDASADAEALLSQLAQGDRLFVSSVLADRYGLKIGDAVRLETKRGVHDFTIVGTVVDFYQGGEVLYGSWNDLQRYFGVNDASVFYLRLAPGQDLEEIQNRIESQYGDRWHITVESNDVLKKSILRGYRQVFMMFDILSLIAIVVAAFGVINTLMVNVLERTRELGTLRSMGLTRRQVAKMILAEAALLGGIGGIFGIVFGIFLERIFLMGSSEISGLQVQFVLPLQGVVLGMLLALLVAQAAAVLPARHAVRLRIIDAIQYE